VWRIGSAGIALYLMMLAAFTIFGHGVDFMPRWLAPLALPPLVYGLFATRWIPRVFAEREDEAVIDERAGGAARTAPMKTSPIPPPPGRPPVSRTPEQSPKTPTSAPVTPVTRPTAPVVPPKPPAVTPHPAPPVAPPRPVPQPVTPQRVPPVMTPKAAQPPAAPSAPAIANVTPERAPMIAPAAPPADKRQDEVVVRIPFARVADQLPADAFATPVTAIGSSLRQPDALLVPQRLVVSQIAEGCVRVEWDIVADQFPAAAKRLTDADIATKLADGMLTLPLDEIFRQLPPSVFAVQTRAPEIESLESFPLPFQPPPSAVVAPITHEPPAPTIAEQPRTVTAPFTAPVAPPVTPLPIPSAPARAVEMAAPAVVASAPAVSPPAARAEVESAADADAVAEVEPLGEVEPPADAEPDLESERAPIVTAPASAEPLVASAAGAETRAVADASTQEHADDTMDTLTTTVPPLGPLTVVHSEMLIAGGVRVVLLSAGGVTRSALSTAVARVVPLLRDGWNGGPAEQVTIRSGAHAVVVSAIGPIEVGGPVLAIAASPRTVALAEAMSQRAAADWIAHADVRADGGTPAGPVDPNVRLQPRRASASIEEIARSIDAFSGLRVAAFHDASEQIDVYLLRTTPTAWEPLRQILSVAYGALPIGEPTLAESSLTIRLGKERVFVRAVEVESRSALLVVAGEVRHAGLAHLQIERAIARLGRASVCRS
jgi:hypothetical protein